MGLLFKLQSKIHENNKEKKMLNKIQFIGRLGKNPELRYTKNSNAVCNFSVASTEKYRDKTTDTQKEETEWLNVVCWQKLAENVNEFVGKGSLVYIEGKLKTRSYDDENSGQKKWVTECVAYTVKFLDKKTDSSKEKTNETSQKKPKGYNSLLEKEYTPETNLEFTEDDIPF